MTQNSGAAWTHQFPTSKDVDDLEVSFRTRVVRFLDALVDAGVEINVTATRRPRQRAYLMHYAWCIVHGKIAPAKVPAFEPEAGEQPVDIRWEHIGPGNKPSHAQSLAAAQAMVHGFSISTLQVAPSLTSLHISGKAIDMTLSWDDDISVNNAHGKPISISSTPRSGINPDLIKVGASYGVHHLLAVHKDPPHWSVNGH
jgi:hypothetical protein